MVDGTDLTVGRATAEVSPRALDGCSTHLGRFIHKTDNVHYVIM